MASAVRQHACRLGCRFYSVHLRRGRVNITTALAQPRRAALQPLPSVHRRSLRPCSSQVHAQPKLSSTDAEHTKALSSLLSASQHGCFQKAVAVPGDFRAGPVAIDKRGQKLYVASGNQVLVQDLMSRRQPPSEVDITTKQLYKIELCHGQHFSFSVGVAGSDSQKVSFEIGLEPVLMVRLPGQVIAVGGSRWLHGCCAQITPDNIDELVSELEALPDGSIVMLAGRLFGEPKTTQRFRPASWPSAISPRLLRALQLMGIPAALLEEARHGDVVAMIGAKSRPQVAKSVRIPSEEANKGLRASGYPSVVEMSDLLPSGEPITGLAIDPQRRRLIASTASQLFDCGLYAGGKVTNLVAVASNFEGASGFAFDQRRGLLYYLAGGKIHARNVVGAASRVVSLPCGELPQIRSITGHHEWLLVVHAEGILVVDQNRRVDLPIAECSNALKAAVVKDRVAIVTNRRVMLAAWSTTEIGTLLAQRSNGTGVSLVPPPLEPWLGLGKVGFPVVGLRPAKTALNSISDVVEHGGEAFVAHDVGVFSLPLSAPPAHVAPEALPGVAAQQGYPEDFAVAVATHGQMKREGAEALTTAGTPPYSLVPADSQPQNGVLLMSPVLQWREGEEWLVRFPLQSPDCCLICGLAPEEDCFANADLLPFDARPSRPRVDGVLIHRPDPWDESSRAVRLHEIMPAEGGRFSWAVGNDILAKLKKAVGLKVEEEPFYMSDVFGGVVLELRGSVRAQARGGLVYTLQSARLQGLQADYPLDVPLIAKPLEPFTMGHGRRVRFYVCALLPPEQHEGSQEPPMAPMAKLGWVPEHLPSMRVASPS